MCFSGARSSKVKECQVNVVGSVSWYARCNKLFCRLHAQCAHQPERSKWASIYCLPSVTVITVTSLTWQAGKAVKAVIVIWLHGYYFGGRSCLAFAQGIFACCAGYDPLKFRLR